MGNSFLFLILIFICLTSYDFSVIFGSGSRTSVVYAADTPTRKRVDALGVISNALQCRKKFYHKMIIYATIREACLLMHNNRQIKGECSKSRLKLKSSTCQFYPKIFTPTSKLKFRSYTKQSTQLLSFPLLQFGELFDGTTNPNPGHERVIFDVGCNAVGATTSDTFRGFTEACTLNVSPPRQGFFSAHYK